MTFFLLLSVIFLKLLISDCIWPPGYRIDLQDNEEFLISDLFANDGDDDDDEMIRMNHTIDNDKFFKIHQFADRYNKKISKTDKQQFNKIINESNFDLEDPVIWQAGYVDENGNLQDNDDDRIEKREEILFVKNLTKNNPNEDYNYDNLNKQYNDEIQKESSNVKTNEIKEDESAEDVVEEIVDFEESKNCTAEESQGIGFNAVRCLAKDIKQSNNRIKSIKRFFRILLIWFCFYLVIAVPCWCHRGYCCCCWAWCFKCCRPRQQLDDARYFFMNNPAGIYQINDDKKLIYTPSIYEESAQKRLEKAILKL